MVLTLDRRRAVFKRANLEGVLGDEDGNGLGVRLPLVLDFIDDDEDVDEGVATEAAAAAAATSSEGNLAVVVLHCSTLGLSKLGGGVVIRQLGVDLVECNLGVDGLLLPPPPDPEDNIPPIPNLTLLLLLLLGLGLCCCCLCSSIDAAAAAAAADDDVVSAGSRRTDVQNARRHPVPILLLLRSCYFSLSRWIYMRDYMEIPDSRSINLLFTPIFFYQGLYLSPSPLSLFLLSLSPLSLSLPPDLSSSIHPFLISWGREGKRRYHAFVFFWLAVQLKDKNRN